MGRRNKVVKKRGDVTSHLQDAVSDEETNETIWEDQLYDQVDNWERNQEKDVIAMMQKGRKKVDKGNMEMYALSGDSDSDLEIPKIKKIKKKKGKQSSIKEAREKAAAELEMLDEDFIGSDDDGKEPEDQIGAFGDKREHFYGGNSGFVHDKDYESESEFEGDVEEEKEGRLIQAKQMDRLQEEDFMGAFGADITANDAKEKDEGATVEEALAPDINQLNPKQLAKLFKQQSPEFDGIVLDFKQRIKEAAKLAKIIQFADQGLLPKGPVTKYVRTKFQILTNYCTNISAYLMFKAKGTNLKLHPVVGRLVEYKNLLDSLEDFDSVVGPQVDKLLERLDAGESIQEIVKEEKRRAKKKMRKQQQTTLKLLQDKKEAVEDKADEAEEGKQRKRKPEPQSLEGLTHDELGAVELYQSIKRKKVDLNEEAVDESDDDNNATESLNPALNDDEEDDVDEETKKRNITYEMAKNKGLTPKRNKLNSNPRLKHRKKFEKAVKRRKGAVREIRTETTRYGGEHSGINARVRKGTKIQ